MTAPSTWELPVALAAASRSRRTRPPQQRGQRPLVYVRFGPALTPISTASSVGVPAAAAASGNSSKQRRHVVEQVREPRGEERRPEQRDQPVPGWQDVQTEIVSSRGRGAPARSTRVRARTPTAEGRRPRHVARGSGTARPRSPPHDRHQQRARGGRPRGVEPQRARRPRSRRASARARPAGRAASGGIGPRAARGRRASQVAAERPSAARPTRSRSRPPTGSAISAAKRANDSSLAAERQQVREVRDRQQQRRRVRQVRARVDVRARRPGAPWPRRRTPRA